MSASPPEMPSPPGSQPPSEGSPLALSEGERQQLFSSSRFRLRLMVASLGLVSALTLLFFVLVGEAFETLTPSIRRDLVNKTRSGVEELKHSADLAMFVGDEPAIRIAARRYLTDSDVLMLRFTDAAGRTVLAHGSADRLPELKSHPPDQLVDWPLAFAQWSTVQAEGLPAGSVELLVSKERLRAGTELHDRLTRVGLLGAVAALVGALVFVNLYVVPILNLGQRTLEKLRSTTRAALVSVEAKSQFLANMSHEIRTPMNGVLGMTQLVLQSPLSERQSRQVQAIDRAARALLRIVNDILDFSKIEANRYQLVLARTSLHELLATAVHLLESTADERALELRLELSRDLPDWCLLDGGRLQQVLVNLVNNAIKFTDQGWVRVAATAEQISDDGFQLTIVVEDTGIGVPVESRERLFDAFTQADNSSTRQHQGTGLGLSISKRLVELMQGSLTVEDRDGPGTVFQIQMPVQRPTARGQALPSAEARSDHPSPGRLPEVSRSVLVVDDNELNQLVAVEMLEHLGLVAEVASSGAEAVDYASDEHYALILMDCQMPGVDGYTATRRIRAAERPERRVPIVACTAHALSGERERVEAAGMDDLLTKPVELEALRAMLNKWLEEEDIPASSETRASRPAQLLTGDVAAREPPPALPDLVERQRSPRFLELFRSRAPEQLLGLRRAAAAADRQELARLAHKLKGSCASCGAERMTALCAELETGADLDAAGIAQRLEALHASLERVLAQLEKRASAPTEPTRDETRGGDA